MRVGYAYDLLRFISILTINKQKHFFYVKELMIRKQMKIKTIYKVCVIRYRHLCHSHFVTILTHTYIHNLYTIHHHHHHHHHNWI